jgi:preprotein translocase subunit SecA
MKLLDDFQRSWMAVSETVHGRTLATRYVPRVLELAEQMNRLADPVLDGRLEELRGRLRDSGRLADIPTWALHSDYPASLALGTLFGKLLGRRCLSLLSSGADYQAACEGLALAMVMMERTTGNRMHPNQIAAALALAEGRVIQLDTGEGKTFVGALRAFLDHLWGLRTTIVAPNDYLSRRDAAWLKDFYHTCGMRSACADGEVGAGPEPGAYQEDVCYVSLPRLMFDHLARVTCNTIKGWIDYRLQSVVIDEVDAVLLDSGTFGNPVYLPAQAEVYQEAYLLATGLTPDVHYQVSPRVQLTSEGLSALEHRRSSYPHLAALGSPACLFHVRCALNARHAYRRDIDYIVEDGRIISIDQGTGRPEPNRELGLGIQQAVETQEGVTLSLPKSFVYEIHPASVLGRATYLSGMSGSAASERIVFRKLYGMSVTVIPPNRPTRRRVWPDELHASRVSQLERVIQLAAQYHHCGRPVLLGTQSIRDAEELASQLAQQGLPVQLITAKNHVDEAAIMRRADRVGAVTVAARMAGRGVDILPDDEAEDAGGLAVINVGRFRVRRLDEQMSGRTGRQGAGGDVHFVLCLDDEIFRYAAARRKKLLRNLAGSVEEGLDLRSISWSIRFLQSSYRDQSYAALRDQLHSERILSPIRDEYEDQRHVILGHVLLKPFIELQIERALSSADTKLLEWLLGTAGRTPTARSGLGTKELAAAGRALLEEYETRRLAAGHSAESRERLILLKCLDFQWAMLYLDWSRHLTLGDASRSPLADDPRFIGRRINLIHREFPEQAAFYLLNIDEEDVLQLCYYWRGIMLPTSSWLTEREQEDATALLTEVSVPIEQLHPLDELDQAPASDRGPLPAGTIPPRPLPALGSDSPLPELERLRVVFPFWARWRAVATSTLYMALGGLLLWWLWPGRRPAAPSWVSDPAGVARSVPRYLWDELSRLLLLGASSRSLGLLICLILTLLLYASPAVRARRAANLLVLPGAIAAALLSDPWAGQPFASHLGAFAWPAAICIATAWLLGSCGVSVFQALACGSALLWLLGGPWPPAGLGARPWVVALIAGSFAVASLATGRRFFVEQFRGWDHTTDTQGIVKHAILIAPLDDVVPLLLAWLWAGALWTVVGSAFSRLAWSVPSVAAGIGIQIAFALVALRLAGRRVAWRHDAQSYFAVEWHWNGTISDGRRNLDGTTLARRVKRRDLLGWAGTLTATSIFAFVAWPDAPPLGRAFALTCAGIVGLGFGQALRHLACRYMGWFRESDLRSLTSAIGSPQISARKRIQSALGSIGGWPYWGTLSLVVLLDIAARATSFY